MVRVLYYTDWGSAGHVGRVSLDGSNRIVLATAERPNDLVIHGNKLLVINNKEPTAELLELDLTTSKRTNQRPLSDTVSTEQLLLLEWGLADVCTFLLLMTISLYRCLFLRNHCL